MKGRAMDALTDEALTALVGLVAAREFRAADECYYAELEEYAFNLPTLTDKRLYEITSAAIYISALVNSFRGNWEHEHFKASACFHESQRRHKLAGHSDTCSDDIYTRAYDAVMKSQGHTPNAHPPCKVFR